MWWLSARWLVLAFTLHSMKTSNAESSFQECGLEMDIVFVLDGSRSVKIDNFNKMIQSLIHFTELIISPTNNIVEVGMVLYSSSVTNTLNLNHNLTIIRKDILAMEYPNAGTHTDEGIEAARLIFMTSGRTEGTDIMIVITDGVSADTTKTLAAAKKAKNSGINIFTVGINQYSNQESIEAMQAELKGIASSPDQVTELTEFGNFEGVVLVLASQVCSVTFLVNVNNATVPVSGTIKLTGTASEAQAAIWRHDNEEIRSGGRYNISVNGAVYTLIITDARINDSGEYMLIVGTSKSRGYVLVVEFLTPLYNISFDAEKDIVLEAVYRKEGMEAMWYFEGKLIVSGGRYTITVSGNRYRLVVKGARTADSGAYAVKIGKVESDCYVTIVVHGSWGAWGAANYTECSVSCGGGQMNVTRKRQCDNPAPENGGRDCNGSDTFIQNEACNTHECGIPVNGGWGRWGSEITTKCTKTCGGGIFNVHRFRSCNNPAPLNGGSTCDGSERSTLTFICNIDHCPGDKVDGSWGAWGSGSMPTACSVTCGSGTRKIYRSRLCNDPSPMNEGKPCPGDQIRQFEEQCNITCTEFGAYLTDQRISLDEEILLEARVEGEGFLGFWYFDDKEIIGGGRYHMEVDGNIYRLRIQRAKIKDSGRYRLYVNGTSSEANITVFADGGWSSWKTVKQGNCTEKCVAVTYLKRTCDKPLPQNGGKPCVGHDKDKEIQPCDDGNCLKLEFLTPLSNKTIHSGEDIVLEAGYSKEGMRATWYYNGKEVNQGRYTLSVDGKKHRLVVKAAHGSDTGNYAVEIARDLSNAFVTVIVDGVWGAWVETYGKCSKTCGNGTRTVKKTRTCNNPAPDHGGEDCPGKDKEENTEYCIVEGCPVNGVWSPWGAEQYGKCSKTCGSGIQTITRTRTCDNPAPAYGGNTCPDDDKVEYKGDCNIRKCPVNGAWGSWGEKTVSACSVTCGDGTKTFTRIRKCDNPAPANGGDKCFGEDKEIEKEKCKIKECPVNGAWGSWGEKNVSACSVTCGDGTKTITRTRKCDNPAPANGGDKCPGDDKKIETENCKVKECKVNGVWSSWGKEQYGTCSMSCGTGTQTVTRTRKCDNPAPAYGGDGCSGKDKEETQKDCKLKECPVNGVWSSWGKEQYGTCSMSCGTGTQTVTRTRKCDNPAPAYGGDGCSGKDKEETQKDCKLKECPVNGVWSSWGKEQYGTCSMSCGTGTQTVTRTRKCDNPAPAYGGDGCSGKDKEETQKDCKLKECPVNGVWSSWGKEQYGTCSMSCGTGTQTVTRTRKCDNPAPAYGGDGCSGKDKEETQKDCKLKECPVNGVWSSWGKEQYGFCSVSCGTGTQTVTRTRTCDNPAPANGGDDCSGKDKEVTQKNCTLKECPVNGVWGPWGEETFDKCSATCGPGTRIITRTKKCDNPAPANGGDKCPGEDKEITYKNCKVKECAVNGVWGSWGEEIVGTCSVTCGNGTKTVTRMRKCDNPAPSNGGDKCPGSDKKEKTVDCKLKDCPVPGAWSNWGEVVFHPCSVTCGDGTWLMTRSRLCDNPAPANGGDDCPGISKEERKGFCKPKECPVNGVWSSWGKEQYGTCSVSCGTGTQTVTRTRKCDNPAPAYGGDDCSGKNKEVTQKDCKLKECPVNGVWSSWGKEQYGNCSVSCGTGTQTITRTRKCDNPAPANGGDDCSGKDKEITQKDCTLKECPVNGVWSSWGKEQYGTCSMSCGTGTQTITRTRKCDNPAPANGGDDCSGKDKEVTQKDCTLKECPVNGVWSSWGKEQYGTCSMSCGTGTQTVTRTRKCDNPAPANGGDDCSGKDKEVTQRNCTLQECPVNGVWSSWGKEQYGTCSMSCGTGTQTVTRTRKCDNPAPANGGDDCSGKDKEVTQKNCTLKECPVNGVWGSWGKEQYGTCSVSCGTGTQTVTRTRKCDNPAPANSGDDCSGKDKEVTQKDCKLKECPVNGVWSSWEKEQYGTCSMSCGTGTQTITRTRKCDNPAPANGGDDCSGKDKEVTQRNCTLKECPVNGVWSSWGKKQYGTCSVSCGTGTHTVTRTRKCDNPAPDNGGDDCSGKDKEVNQKDCKLKECPVNGAWGSWGEKTVSACSVTCGDGTKTITRTRKCDNPAPANGGDKCSGEDKEIEKENCKVKECPVNGDWGPWGKDQYSKCSVTCGAGTRTITRTRKCDNPAPANGGDACSGKDKEEEQKYCKEKQCPVNGDWSPWGKDTFGKCSVTCGPGTRIITRTRKCDNPAPANGGIACSGIDKQEKQSDCKEKECPVHGSWSAWGKDFNGRCSVTCGTGRRTVMRTRSCDNPAPAYGGDSCAGKDTNTREEDCKIKECAVHGSWGPWGKEQIGSCSVSCGTGVRSITKTRLCNNPAPLNGGNTCPGTDRAERKETCKLKECPVHGGWSPWGEEQISSCTKTCDKGTQTITRRRLCNNPLPAFGGDNCPGKDVTESQIDCKVKDCAVDGKWSSWSENRMTCSVTCGGGKQKLIRKRVCNNPSPQNGGRNCVGKDSDEIEVDCNTRLCPGNWSPWTVESKSDCTASCGQGSRTEHKTRRCVGGEVGKSGCIGPTATTETKSCTPGPCYGSWGPWNNDSFSDCSVTCGRGFKTVRRTRICNQGIAVLQCKGQTVSTETISCNDRECSGTWSPWNMISSTTCSVSCGPGTKTIYKSRTCIGGTIGQNNCKGLAKKKEIRQCNERTCRGRWSIWHEISRTPCSATCDDGTLTVYLSRTCIGGIPGQLGCEGSISKSEKRTCNEGSCSRTWSAWTEYSSEVCSVTCGTGTYIVYLSRKCIGGSPGESGCRGSQYLQQTKKCQKPVCSGRWGPWKDFSSTPCSVSCGPGIKTVKLTRTCIGGNNGGPGCNGVSQKTEFRYCNDKDCLIPGKWSNWKEDSSTNCSQPCGLGSKTVNMSRTCIGGTIGQAGCEGLSHKTETVSCNEGDCLGHWSNWKIFSSIYCSVSCGPGTKIVNKVRTCIGGTVGQGGCIGLPSMKGTVSCNNGKCPVGWTEWKISSSTSCSVSCGAGSKTVSFSRTCIGANVGETGCEGLSQKSETQTCNSGDCLGAWSDWKADSTSACSKTCGPGTKRVQMSRKCIGGTVGRNGCEGLSQKSEIQTCNDGDCLGAWGEWNAYSTSSCSKTCGPGTKRVLMSRKCIGGTVGRNGCEGLSQKSEIQTCNDGDCLGAWSEWNIDSTSACSKTCGPGTKRVQMSRKCIGGTIGRNGCEGLSQKSEIQTCNDGDCLGAWGEWNAYSTSSCSKTCGPGTKRVLMSRKCIGGTVGRNGCEGLSQKSEIQTCNDGDCLGAWSEWNIDSTSACSKTCGPGTKRVQMSRKCIGGTIGRNGCEGLSQKSEIQTCNDGDCLGAWGEWNAYLTSSCSKTCGPGTKRVLMSRKCIGGTVGRNGCEGLSQKSEIQTCNDGDCLGAWSKWNIDSTSACSKTCGPGTKRVQMSRKCIGGTVGRNGCEGLSHISETKTCNDGNCLGAWSEWKVDSTSACSKTCGPGTKRVQMSRKCIGGTVGRNGCEGLSQKSETLICNDGNCLGAWSEWKVDSTSACSKTCGSGTKSVQMSRKCIGGTVGRNGCEGFSQKSETQTCNNGDCLGAWSDWKADSTSACSKTCGPGTKSVHMSRKCIGGTVGRNGCEGLSQKSETQTCNNGDCLGTWSQWNADSTSACSKTCGPGTKSVHMSRKCIGGTVGRNGCEGLSQKSETQTCNNGDCLGTWSEWKADSTSACSKTCGPGTKRVQMSRKCIGGTVGRNGCEGLSQKSEIQTCNDGDCLGAWGEWNAYSTSSCSKTCGPGTKRVQLSRKCIGGTVGRNGCEGLSQKSETLTCNDGDCLGAWSEWKADSTSVCSKTCGPGTKRVQMSRKCIGGTVGRNGCEGLSQKSETQTCNSGDCLGTWSDWKADSTSACSATCGPGTKLVYLSRKCIGGSVGRKGCEGLSVKKQYVYCNEGVCPGKWSPWTENFSTKCSVTCDFGSKTVHFSRTCIGGSIGQPGCEGQSKKFESQSCNDGDCLGNWSQWKFDLSSACSKTCGPGTKRVYMSRKCIGGTVGRNGCEGLSQKSESQTCNNGDCLGTWSEWKADSTSACSKTCGPGTKSVHMSRKCIGGTVGRNGCEGLSQKSETLTCNDGDCLGAWSEWKADSTSVCSKTCGPGTKRVQMSRKCIGGTVGRNGCEGLSQKSETQTCNSGDCLGTWSDWKANSTSACSATCGPGTKLVYLSRKCIGGSVGRKGCEGLSVKKQYVYCNEGVCPGKWSPWTEYFSTKCSVTCDFGSKTVHFSRTCIGGSIGQPGCEGQSKKFESQSCNDGDCLGNWSQWKVDSTSACSKTCGPGTKSVHMSRKCIGGTVGRNGCEGLSQKSETLTCNDGDCLGAWSDWKADSTSACSKTCGPGTKSVHMSRKCIGGTVGRNGCEGLSQKSETLTCNDGDCLGAWSDWKADSTSACSKTCGPGTKSVHMSRKCIGGTVGRNGCEGLSQKSETQTCNNGDCLGTWSDWKADSTSACSKTCGPGTKSVHMLRKCIGGNGCEGFSQKSEIQTCNDGDCLGAWSKWKADSTSACSKTCGPGTKRVQMSRKCIGGTVGRNGCEGLSQKSETKTCNDGDCLGAWSEWKPDSTSPCSKTCGPGTQLVYLSRKCIGGSVGRKGCEGVSVQKQYNYCNKGVCPGKWSPWTEYFSTKCSVTCDSGSKTVHFRRTCIGGSIGQPGCEGQSKKYETQSCNDGACLGNWSQWKVDSSSACSVSCGPGTKTVYKSRTCIGGTAGQSGCSGKAAASEQKTCLLETCPALCTSAEFVQGVGYRGHPTDCNKYVQCYYSPEGKTIAVYRTCPFGYFWDQSSIRCDTSCRVKCPLDKCTDSRMNNYDMDGSCRAYWECKNGKSEARCCPDGFMYVPGKGCKLNLSCRDPCPTVCTEKDSCIRRPVWNSKNKFEVSLGVLGWIQSGCPKNDLEFDINECACVARNKDKCYAEFTLPFNNGQQNDEKVKMEGIEISKGAAIFSGSSRIRATVTPATTTNAQLVLHLRYKEADTVTGQQVVLATTQNCACSQSTNLTLTLEDDNVLFQLQSTNEPPIQLSISTRGFLSKDWKEVILIYDGKTMMGITKSGKIQYNNRIQAYCNNLLDCCLDFGSGGSMTSFKGEMDDISLYRCWPSDKGFDLA